MGQIYPVQEHFTVKRGEGIFSKGGVLMGDYGVSKAS